MTIPYLKDFDELVYLMRSSFGGNGKTVMLSRNKKILINPSAKTTLLAWDTNKYVRGFVYEICGEGDGCKTAIFILHSLLRELNKKDKPYPINFNLKEIEVSEPSREDLEKIAPNLPSILYDALLTNGTDIHISVEVGEGVDIEVIHSEGYIGKCPTPRWEKEITLKGPMIAMISRPINKVEEITPILENLIEGRPLVIVAPYYSKQVLDVITLNRNKGVIDAYAIETPKVTWSNEWLKDLESFVGGEVQVEHHKEYNLDWYGSAFEVKIKLNEVIFEQYEDKVELTSKRIDRLNYEADHLTSDLYFMREQLKQRVSALSGSLIRVKVGGITEVEARNRRTVIEKMIQTLVSAIRGGVIKEGLVLHCNELSSQYTDEVISKALRVPLKAIMDSVRVSSINDIDMDKLRVPFPYLRYKELMGKVESIVNVWSSIGLDITKAKV